MSMFSGITVALREDNGGFELNMADVRMEFDESFRVLNSTAVEFDQWCAALDRLSQLNQEIEQHDGKADKALIMFLNQNNDLAEVLGVDLSLENWDEEAKGAEIRQGYSMAMEGLWESIKAFFKKIFDGIASFFTWIGSFFGGLDKKVSSIENNPNIGTAIDAGKGGPSKGLQKISNTRQDGMVTCVLKSSLGAKIKTLQNTCAYIGGIQTEQQAINELVVNTAGEIGQLLVNLGFTKEVKDKMLVFNKPASLWSDKDIGNPGKDVASAFKNAGWSSADFKEGSTLRQMVAAVKEASNKAAGVKGLIEKFLNIKDDAELQQKLGADANVKAARDVGRVILQIISVCGEMTKSLSDLANDALSINSAINKAENEKNAAAQAKQAAENAKQQEAQNKAF